VQFQCLDAAEGGDVGRVKNKLPEHNLRAWIYKMIDFKRIQKPWVCTEQG